MSGCVEFVVTLIGAVGAVLGGIGACWAAIVAQRTTRQAAKSQKAAEKRLHHQEQRRAKAAAVANLEDATSILNDYSPEMIARIRSLKRLWKREGMPQVSTDINALSKELQVDMNALGAAMDAEKKTLAETPLEAVEDWRLKEIETQDWAGRGRSLTQRCRHFLNEFEDALADTIRTEDQG